VEAPALRLDASKAREQLGWTPRLDLAAGLAATVSWHDSVREGADARAVTMTQIEEAS
jgi:CDP-glucose 4,6-dehydratase